MEPITFTLDELRAVRQGLCAEIHQCRRLLTVEADQRLVKTTKTPLRQRSRLLKSLRSSNNVPSAIIDLYQADRLRKIGEAVRSQYEPSAESLAGGLMPETKMVDDQAAGRDGGDL